MTESEARSLARYLITYANVGNVSLLVDVAGDWTLVVNGCQQITTPEQAQFYASGYDDVAADDDYFVQSKPHAMPDSPAAVRATTRILDDLRGKLESDLHRYNTLFNETGVPILNKQFYSGVTAGITLAIAYLVDDLTIVKGE